MVIKPNGKRFFTRNRKERPCDGCRRRKTRCTRIQDKSQCEVCLKHEEKCTYVMKPVDRNQKPVRPFELKQRETFATATRELSIGLELGETFSPEEGESDHSVMQSDNNIQDYFHHSQFLTMNEEYYSQVIQAPFYDINYRGSFSSEIQVNYDQFLRPVGLGTAFLMIRDKTRQHEKEAFAAVENLVAPYSERLRNLYFTMVQPSYPIIHKSSFLWKQNRQEVSPVLLGAIYYVALSWWNYDPSLTGEPKPDEEVLRQLVLTFYKKNIERPRLATIQAGLLLLHRTRCSKDTRIDIWNITSELVSAAMILGLNLDCSEWTIPSWELPPRRRVAWAVFIQERWCSALYGLPSRIENKHWFVPMLDIDDFEPDNEVKDLAYLMIELVRLTVILSDIVDTCYSLEHRKLDKPGALTLEMLWESLEPIKGLAENCHNNVNYLLSKQKTTASPANKDNSSCTHRLFAGQFVSLSSLTIRCMIQKQYIRNYHDITYGQLVEDDRQSQFKTQLENSTRQCIDDCMSFITNLDANSLEAFWTSHCTLCITQVGSLISLSQSTSTDEVRHEYDEIRQKLRWKLCVSSTCSTMLEDSLIHLEALDWKFA